MTRSRLAATAALSISVLLVMSSGGDAQTDDVDFDLQSSCTTDQRTDRDFGKIKSLARKRMRGGPRGPGRRGDAAAVEPVVGAKVVTKLRDLTTADGNDVVDGKDVDRTNQDGIAKTKVEFDNFGNYRVTSKLKVDGEVVAKDTINFGVADRESGKCDPPLVGAG